MTSLCYQRVCVVMLVTVGLWMFPAAAKLSPGASCGNAKEHCDAPKSEMGCCVGNTQCYSTEDCASFLKTCPFSDDTKKGKSMLNCLGKDKPKSADFKKAACSPEAKGRVKSTDGKDVPLKSNVTCFQTDKVRCDVYRNATGWAFFSVTCKEEPKKSSSAPTKASGALWQGCLLLALLGASILAVLGLPM